MVLTKLCLLKDYDGFTSHIPGYHTFGINVVEDVGKVTVAKLRHGRTSLPISVSFNCSCLAVPCLSGFIIVIQGQSKCCWFKKRFYVNFRMHHVETQIVTVTR